jgi:CheY-like chemotaxis protein
MGKRAFLICVYLRLIFGSLPERQVARRESGDKSPQIRLRGGMKELVQRLLNPALSMSQHILVVDDESQIRELLSVYLTRQGYRVSTTASSAETMRLVNQTSIDLVVLDIGLAEEDGLKLLSAIKAEHPDLRVVMLTGMGFVEELLQEANQNGADG